MAAANPLLVLGWIAKIGAALWSLVVILYLAATGEWRFDGGVTLLFCLAVAYAAGVDTLRIVIRRRREAEARRQMASALRGGK